MNSDNEEVLIGDEQLYETDDINFAALLRAKGIKQVSNRTDEFVGERPRVWFVFGERDRCLQLYDQLQISDVEVGYNALSHHIMQVRSQVFKRPSRRVEADLPPFLRNRRR